MVKADNPAGRLYKILEEVKKDNTGTPAYIIWAKAFGIEPNEKLKLFSYMVLVNQLYRETIDSINSLSGINKELYLQNLPSIERVIAATNLDVGWNHYFSILSDLAMQGLAFCSDKLSEQGIEQPIEQSSLDDLRKEIEDLIEAAANSKLDNAIKIVILDQLEALRRSIFEYKLRGAKGLKEALDMSIMAMIRNHDLFKTEGKKEEVQRFGKIITKLDKVVSGALKVKELGFTAAKLLGYDISTLGQ